MVIKAAKKYTLPFKKLISIIGFFIERDKTKGKLYKWKQSKLR